MDIVDALRETSTHLCDGSALTCEAPSVLLMRAADEIERLRGLAGAVSPGPSFQEIRETTPKVLKAFDGA